jgi:hypothetical protein
MTSILATTFLESLNAPPPFKSPLPLREGGRGRGLRASARGWAKDRLRHPGRPTTVPAGPGGGDPLPLPPSRGGRGDSKGAMRESDRAATGGDRR